MFKVCSRACPLSVPPPARSLTDNEISVSLCAACQVGSDEWDIPIGSRSQHVVQQICSLSAHLFASRSIISSLTPHHSLHLPSWALSAFACLLSSHPPRGLSIRIPCQQLDGMHMLHPAHAESACIPGRTCLTCYSYPNQLLTKMHHAGVHFFSLSGLFRRLWARANRASHPPLVAAPSS